MHMLTCSSCEVFQFKQNVFQLWWIFFCSGWIGEDRTEAGGKSISDITVAGNIVNSFTDELEVIFCFCFYLEFSAFIYLVFLSQIWTMLPGFCTKPTDVVSSFKGIARSLGMAITEHSDLRMCIYQALRTLIYKSCETGGQLCGRVWLFSMQHFFMYTAQKYS